MWFVVSFRHIWIMLKCSYICKRYQDKLIWYVTLQTIGLDIFVSIIIDIWIYIVETPLVTKPVWYNHFSLRDNKPQNISCSVLRFKTFDIKNIKKTYKFIYQGTIMWTCLCQYVNVPHKYFALVTFLKYLKYVISNN